MTRYDVAQLVWATANHSRFDSIQAAFDEWDDLTWRASGVPEGPRWWNSATNRFEAEAAVLPDESAKEIVERVLQHADKVIAG